VAIRREWNGRERTGTATTIAIAAAAPRPSVVREPAPPRHRCRHPRLAAVGEEGSVAAHQRSAKVTAVTTGVERHQRPDEAARDASPELSHGRDGVAVASTLHRDVRLEGWTFRQRFIPTGTRA
jgi:hypothetical protein